MAQWIYHGPYQGHDRAGWRPGMLRMPKASSASYLEAVDKQFQAHPGQSQWFSRIKVFGVWHGAMFFRLRDSNGDLVPAAFFVTPTAEFHAADVWRQSMEVFPEVWRHVPGVAAAAEGAA